MKILQINNFHYRKGGSEAVYFNTAGLLQNKGHSVVFFSCSNKENENCSNKDHFIKSLSEVSRLKGIFRYFYNKEAKRNLEELVKREKPDIAHVHLFWGGISPSIFSVLRKYNIPLVHTAHDYRMVCPAYTFTDINGNVCEKCNGKYFYKCAVKRCSKGNILESIVMAGEMYFRNLFFNPVRNLSGVLFVSNFSKQKHLQFAKDFRNIPLTVLHNFAFETGRSTPQNNANSYFLYYGRLSSEKGLKTLVKTFSKLPDLYLKIVGAGTEKAFISDYIKSNNINNIELSGYKKGNELKELISGASFVIVPSEWYENNPMTIIEAYSHGKPVIGSSIGGIPEIIDEGKTGFLFEAKNSDSLKEKLKLARSLSEQEYQIMSENALQFADKNFNPETYYNRLIKFYQEVINQ